MRVVAKAMRHGRLGLLAYRYRNLPFGNIFWSIQRLPQAAAATGYQTPRCFGQTIIVSALALPGSCQCRPLNSWSLATMPIPRYKNFLENEK